MDDFKFEHKTFNIEFFSAANGGYDETQFDIAVNSVHYTDDGTLVIEKGTIDIEGMMVQLLGLWEEFRQENGIMDASILSVTEVPYSEE